ncbi:MAG: tripartite tricarboxylate transporter permease [archaeon]
MIFVLVVLALMLGIIAGIFTGLVPGIHINFVALIISSSAGILLEHFSAIAIASFIIAMAVTHSFFDFIPSIFLSAPNSETALSVMPGHNLLLKGKGYAAARLALIGCYAGLIILILTAPLFLYIMPLVYDFIKRFMAVILIVSSLYLMVNEKNKILALFIFIISGVLGFASLNLNLNQPLFPLLTGLFGTSMIVTSISEKAKIPKQEMQELRTEKGEIPKAVSAGLIASGLCSFLPGLGASQAAVIGSEICGKTSEKCFLFLLGIISTLVTGLNFVAIYAIGKPRSGVAIAAADILQSVSMQQLYLLLAVAVVSGGIALVISLHAAKIFAKNINRIDYAKISIALLLFLFVMCIIFSGWLGIIILVTATSLGIFAIKANVRKMHLMGCIMLPVILYFL